MSSLPESSSLVIPVNELNFAEEVLSSPIPVLVDVSARWCAPCKVAAPVVAAIAQRYRGELKVALVDGDESPDLVAKLGVRGFPTFVGFSGAEVVESQAGFGGARALDALAERLTRRAAPARAAERA